jgi:hypothetical protein
VDLPISGGESEDMALLVAVVQTGDGDNRFRVQVDAQSIVASMPTVSGFQKISCRLPVTPLFVATTTTYRRWFEL